MGSCLEFGVFPRLPVQEPRALKLLCGRFWGSIVSTAHQSSASRVFGVWGIRFVPLSMGFRV